MNQVGGVSEHLSLISEHLPKGIRSCHQSISLWNCKISLHNTAISQTPLWNYSRSTNIFLWNQNIPAT